MFWIKSVFIAAILLIIFMLGLEFSNLNSDLVTIRHLQGSVTTPLSLVVISAFTSGVLLTIVVGMFVVLPFGWQISRLRKTLHNKDQEIKILTKKLSHGERF